jgi:hypothetical protein
MQNGRYVQLENMKTNAKKRRAATFKIRRPM